MREIQWLKQSLSTIGMIRRRGGTVDDQDFRTFPRSTILLIYDISLSI